jgi:hypothetical protein
LGYFRVVELPDSVLTAIGFGVPILIGFLYFTITRKDRNKFDNQTSTRDEEEGERDKQELARKVKKELMDEAEKVEAIRKAVAVDVKEANQEYVDQKNREIIRDFDHKISMHEQKEDSMFKASDLIMKNLMDKIVETAKIQADAIVKINDALEYLRRLVAEASVKVNRVEKEQDTKRRTN